MLCLGKKARKIVLPVIALSIVAVSVINTSAVDIKLNDDGTLTATEKFESKTEDSKYGFKEEIDPFYGAPVILAVLADKTVPTYIYDGSLVLGNMLNAAESLGLGSIWIHRAKEEFELPFGKELLKNLEIEGDYEGIGFCALGYKNKETPKATPRKDNYIYYIR